MAKKRGPKGPKTLEEKMKDLDEFFVDEIRSTTAEGVKDKLIKLDRYEGELEDARKEDADLASKKEAAKVAGETYSIPLKAIKLKRAFALKVLTEKGQ